MWLVALMLFERPQRKKRVAKILSIEKERGALPPLHALFAW